MKTKKKSFPKHKKSSLESDDLGFGSYRMPIPDDFKREVKISICPLKGVIYYY